MLYRKNKRERLTFELYGKKRKDGIGRFCHRTDSLLISSKIKSSGKYIIDELQEQIAAAKCKNGYAISWFEELDGKEFNKNEVLKLIVGAGPSIAIFDDFAIIETEPVQGPAIKYLLQK